MTEEPILQVNDLKKYFTSASSSIEKITSRLFDKESGEIKAVDGVNIECREKGVQGVIGESGCGKTTLLNTICGLHDKTSGKIIYRGTEKESFDAKSNKTFHKNVQVIFQDPFNAINPKFTVYDALLEPLKIHDLDDHTERIYKVLTDVELSPPEEYLNKFPHQLSGGEKQRVSIARALIVNPELILADEPISMLDVSTQAAIINLFKSIISEYEVSILYISHDISTLSHICDEVNVMYLGRIVEKGPTKELLNNPKHPYTKALINAVPIPDPRHNRRRVDIDGTPGNPINLPTGCRFKDRCPERMDICDIDPKMVFDGENEVACHLYYEHET